jgi:hypothetical protein
MSEQCGDCCKIHAHVGQQAWVVCWQGVLFLLLQNAANQVNKTKGSNLQVQKALQGHQ